MSCLKDTGGHTPTHAFVRHVFVSPTHLYHKKDGHYYKKFSLARRKAEKETSPSQMGKGNESGEDWAPKI